VNDVATGEAVRLGKEGAQSWAPEWSTDGSRVAYYSNETGLAQLWVWDLATRESRRVSDRIVRTFFGWDRPRWCFSGKKLLVKALQEGLTIEQANALIARTRDAGSAPRGKCTAVVYGEPQDSAPDAQDTPPQRRNMYLCDLVLFDVETGQSTPVASGYRPAWYALSPDGQHVVFADLIGLEDHDGSPEAPWVIYVYRLADGKQTLVLKGIPLFEPEKLSWSPDSRILAIEDNTLAHHGMCHVVDVATGEEWMVGDCETPHLDEIFRAPLWSPDGETILLVRDRKLWKVSVADQSLVELPLNTREEVIDLIASREGREYWSPDGGVSVGVLVLDDKKRSAKLALVDLGSGECRDVTDGSRHYFGLRIYGMDVTPDGKTLALVSQDVKHPMDIWVYDVATDTHRQATHLNPQLESIELGASRLVEWFKADGTKVEGTLLLPAGYETGKRYPVIVAFHPELTPSRTPNKYAVDGARGLNFTDMQLLASRGYAVFMPDVPVNGPTQMADIAEAIFPGIDMLVDSGIADPDRLGVIGQSLGGYGVMALLVQTTRFKAAVASSSLCDLIADCTQTCNGEIGVMRWLVDSLGGTLWEQRERYIENSPIFFMDRVETPLLIICGGIDPRTPPHMNEQAYACLKYLNKPVVYVKYEGESHLPSNYSRANVLDYTNRVIAWFDKYVMGWYPRSPVP